MTREITHKHCRWPIIKLLCMDKSTTKFLEILSKKKLNVQADFQKEISNGGRLEIVRLAKLYFEDPDHVIILSISSIFLENLSVEEIQLVREGKIPLGRIFGAAGMNSLNKTGISIKSITDERLAKKLNVFDNQCFSKEYTLWTGQRQVGTIKEIFNEESFLRVWS